MHTKEEMQESIEELRLTGEFTDRELLRMEALAEKYMPLMEKVDDTEDPYNEWDLMKEFLKTAVNPMNTTLLFKLIKIGKQWDAEGKLSDV